MTQSVCLYCILLATSTSSADYTHRQRKVAMDDRSSFAALHKSFFLVWSSTLSLEAFEVVLFDGHQRLSHLLILFQDVFAGPPWVLVRRAKTYSLGMSFSQRGNKNWRLTLTEGLKDRMTRQYFQIRLRRLVFSTRMLFNCNTGFLDVITISGGCLAFSRRNLWCSRPFVAMIEECVRAPSSSAFYVAWM